MPAGGPQNRVFRGKNRQLTWGKAAPKHRALARTALAKRAARCAQMAELVDALVSGTSAARRGGSSPLLGTICSFGHVRRMPVDPKKPVK